MEDLGSKSYYLKLLGRICKQPQNIKRICNYTRVFYTYVQEKNNLPKYIFLLVFYFILWPQINQSNGIRIHEINQSFNFQLPTTKSFRLFMAGTCPPATPHVIGSSVVELSRTASRTGAPLSVRISSRSYAVPITAVAAAHDGRFRTEGPSCIFVGPVETASQENLEALYRQVSSCSFLGVLNHL